MLAFSSIPLACLIPFFLHDTWLSALLKEEFYCRIFVGLGIGLILCTYLMLSKRFWKSFLVVPIAIYFFLKVPGEEFFFQLLGTNQKRIAFCLLAVGHGIVPIVRLLAGLWHGVKDFFRSLFLGPKTRAEKDIASILQQSLNVSASVKKKELALNVVVVFNLHHQNVFH